MARWCDEMMSRDGEMHDGVMWWGADTRWRGDVMRRGHEIARWCDEAGTRGARLLLPLWFGLDPSSWSLLFGNVLDIECRNALIVYLVEWIRCLCIQLKLGWVCNNSIQTCLRGCSITLRRRFSGATKVWTGSDWGVASELNFLQLKSQLLTDKLPVLDVDPGEHTCPWWQDAAATN